MSRSPAFGWLLLLACLPLTGWSQAEYVDDAAVWVDVGIEKKLHKRWDLNLEHQLRFNYNISEMGRSSTDLGFTYKPLPYIHLLGEFTYMLRRQPDESFNERIRLGYGALLRFNHARWSFRLRSLLQSRLDLPQETHTFNTVFRNRFYARYELFRQIEPYVYYEVNYPIDQSRDKGFNRERYCAGFIYHYSRSVDLECYYLFRQQLNAFNETNRDFVSGIKCTYRF